MDRRHYLGTLASVALAGCTVGYRDRHDRSTPVATAPLGPTTRDLDLPVPADEIVEVLPKDGIPAIVDPVFGEDWSGIAFETYSRRGGRYTARPRLTETDRVVGVVRDGEARAYPLALLDWHEVVNDHFGGPLLVTFCPLCGSAVVAERRVAGAETVFGVSGNLWHQDLVLYDRATESLWSQLYATAIRGPRTGDRLRLVPATLTTWPEWQDSHPDTRVLRPPPESSTVAGNDATRDYSRDPYLGYGSTEQIGIGGEFDDDRLHPKTRVLGIQHDGEAVAYPREPVVERGGVVNDVVGGLPVVVATSGDTLVGYVRRVDGEVVRFRPAGDARLHGGGSRWQRSTGVAVDGPHEGAALRPATGVPPLFFFAWLEFTPGTRVFGE